jgi:hypothetical protein
MAFERSTKNASGQTRRIGANPKKCVNMSEHDIDKYFRDHLQGVEEPILPSDFSEFEKLAGKKRSGKWLYMLLLLPLIGVSAYFYINPQFNAILPNTASQGNKKTQTIETTSKEGTDDSDSKSNENGDSQTTMSTGVDTTIDISDQFTTSKNAELENQKNLKANAVSANSNEMNPEVDSASENQKKRNENSDSNDKHISESTNTSGLTKNPLSNTAPAIVPAANKASSSTTSTDELRNVVAAASVKPNNKAENTSGNNNYKEPFSRIGETTTQMEADFQKLPVIGLSEIDLSTTPQLNDNIEKTAIPELKSWGIDAFVQFEINNELGGIPSAGFISSWQKNKWNLGIGLGIGQTGTLNWTQSQQDISYGFDVYEENYQLKTENYTFISMPIHLAYRVLPRSEVFIGFTPQMIVNASQVYGLTESNQNQSTGYLYNTGAPRLLLFLNLGYGFSLTENLKLDLGMNYSPQNWNVTENNPLGGFVRLKYNIK